MKTEDTVYYYEKKGEKIGPVTFSEMGETFRLGILSPQTLVWKKGLPNWVRFSELSEFSTAPKNPEVEPPPLKPVAISLSGRLISYWNRRSVLGKLVTLLVVGLLASLVLSFILGSIVVYKLKNIPPEKISRMASAADSKPGRLGIVIRSLTDAEQTFFVSNGYPNAFCVDGFEEASEVTRANIQPGDYILETNGQKLTTTFFCELVQQSRGKSITLKIYRNQAIIMVTVPIR